MDLHYNGKSIHITKLETRRSGKTAVVVIIQLYPNKIRYFIAVLRDDVHVFTMRKSKKRG